MKNPPPKRDRSAIPKRLLIIRLGAIGDVLLATPLIRMLKKAHPDSKIDFLVKNAYVSLLNTNPYCERVHAFSPKGGLAEMARVARLIRIQHYDAVIDCQGNFRSRIFTMCSGAASRSRARLNRWKRFLLVHFHRDTYRSVVPVALKYLSAVPFFIPDDGLGLELNVPEGTMKIIRTEFTRQDFKNNDRIVGLAPGAGRATKRWPLERFAEVGQALSNQGYRIVLIGGKKDADICRFVRERLRPTPGDFFGRFSLMETAAVIKRCELLVTNDTGVMHMASAVGTRSLALFGPTTRHFGFFPFRSEAAVLEKPLPCRPCSYHGSERCPKTHFRCMLDISSREAVKRAVKLLNTR